MAEDVLERLAFMRHEPKTALVIGDWTGMLVQALQTQGAVVTSFQPGELDEEAPLPGAPYDLVVNLQCLDTVNDLPGALIHARLALAEGGLFIASFLGAGTLAALKQVLLAADGERPAARIHPQVDSQAASGLLQRAGFARQVVDSHTLKASYAEWRTLVEDLRAQGLTSMLSSHAPPLQRSSWDRAEVAWREHQDVNGRVTESFAVLTLTGWR
jgi:SAM-dependent methyltransferase